MLEIELKFKIEDTGIIVEKLESMGAEKIDGGLEKNITFDHKGELKKNGELLRLRFYCNRADITHKRSAPKDSLDPKFKIKEETILNVDSFESAKELLEKLGFKPSGVYEKKRQTWEIGETGILVDEMPFIGKFIEIEGTKEKIVEIAGKLGLEISSGITKNYAMLFDEYCKKNNVKDKEMVF